MSILNCKNLPVGLYCLILCLLLSACGQGNTSESSDILNFSDATTDAAQFVADANEDLNKIKVIYKDNEAKRAELTEAIKGKNVEKVKETSNDLIDLINGGMVLGKSAVEKISKAREMNINPDFKEYLRLKEESLRKQMEAFDNYREAAGFLRDRFDPKDEKQYEAVKIKFEEKQMNVNKIMESAQQYSKEANDLAKESAKRSN